MLAGIKTERSNNPRKEYSLHWSNTCMTHCLCSTLPNTLMSKNWTPMAKDFSSEATDLRKTDRSVAENRKSDNRGVGVCVVSVCAVGGCVVGVLVWVFVWCVFVLWVSV